jgi:hypothetical protein
VYVGGWAGTPTDVGRTTVRLKAEATMLMRGRRRRRAGRPGSMARGGGRAPEAGEDSTEEEEDGEEADAMSMGMRSPERSGQVEEETGCVPGADGGRPAGGRGR